MSWQKVKLGDVASFVNGYAFKPSDWSQAGMEIIRIQNLTKSSGESNYFLGKLDERYKVIKGDILISWSATLGCYEWNGSDAWLNQHIFKVVFNKRKIDKVFFKYLINYVLDELKQQVHGATMKHITKDKFDNTLVPLPPLDVQKKIADILDKADTLRRKDAELIKKYDELAQSIFIDMFGDPVTNPKGWEIKKLSEVCFKITDGTHQSPKFQDYGIPFIFVSNIVNNNINYKTNTYISEEEYSVLSRRTPIEVGNILLTTVGSYGNSAIIHSLNPFAFQRHIAFIQPNHELINYKFLFAQLKSDSVKRQIDKKVRGVAQKTLNLSDLKNIEIWLPNLELQNLFGCILDNTNEIMDTVTYCVDNSEQLFQSLLQRAFNGELVH